MELAFPSFLTSFLPIIGLQKLYISGAECPQTFPTQMGPLVFPCSTHGSGIRADLFLEYLRISSFLHLLNVPVPSDPQPIKEDPTGSWLISRILRDRGTAAGVR